MTISRWRQKAMSVAVVSAVVIAGLDVARCGEATPFMFDRWPDGSPKWKTTDSVAVRYYGSTVSDWPGNGELPAASFSPDGRYFYVIHTRGDLACDCLVQTLDLYEIKSVMQAVLSTGVDVPRPNRSLEMRLAKRSYQASIGDVMKQLRWSEDGAALFLVGPDENSDFQLYRLDLGSGRLQAMTQGPLYKSGFRTGPDDVVVYRQTVPADFPVRPSYPVLPAPRDPQGEIRIPERRVPERRMEWVVVRKGESPWVLPLAALGLTSQDLGQIEFSFAPDGRRAVLLPIRGMYWYSIEEALRAPEIPSYPFVLIDFEERKLTRLGMAGPVRFRTAADIFWSKDGSQVVMVNTIIPTEQDKAPAVAAYDLTSGHWRRLETLAAGDEQQSKLAPQKGTVGWLVPGEQLLVKAAATGNKSATVYMLQRGSWAARAVDTSVDLPKTGQQKAMHSGPDLVVTLRQSANDPPVLIASVDGKDRVLSRPDPALRRPWRARVDPFRWTMPDGTKMNGGLAVPQGARKGDRLSLVIQAYQYLPNTFAPDGPWPTAYARQALVAQGMAVLDLDIRDLPDGPEQQAIYMARVDAAVDALDREGWIDRARIGMVGFSYGGYLTFYSLTHPGRTRLAAAHVADSTIHSFPQYMAAYLGGAPLSYTSRRIYGPDSFWDGKSTSLEKDVLFNADKVYAPVLFMATNISCDAASEMDYVTVPLIAALQINRKPFDFLCFEESGHPLWRPRERVASMDATVDWLAFWLLDREDPDSAKTEQYARWRMIRDQWKSTQAEEDLKRNQASVAPPHWGHLSGEWNSNFGIVVVSVTGNTIRGHVKSAAGNPGFFEGVIDGKGAITCKWEEPAQGGKVSAGKGLLTVIDRSILTGTWGHGESATNGGQWRLSRYPPQS